MLPHLAKDQVSKPLAKVFTGEDLNVLVGSRPYEDGNDEKDLVKLNVMSILNKKYGIVEGDFRQNFVLFRHSKQEISALTQV